MAAQMPTELLTDCPTERNGEEVLAPDVSSAHISCQMLRERTHRLGRRCHPEVSGQHDLAIHGRPKHDEDSHAGEFCHRLADNVSAKKAPVHKPQ